jgi:hypothetical protein
MPYTDQTRSVTVTSRVFSRTARFFHAHMPAVRTEKDQKRWKSKKERSEAQKANCFGSHLRVTGPMSRTPARGKENTPRRPASSHVASSPYLTSSPASITSADATLALKLRSDKYERKCRNLARQVSRAADRKAELEERIRDLRMELSGIKKSSSAFAASLQRISKSKSTGGEGFISGWRKAMRTYGNVAEQ